MSIYTLMLMSALHATPSIPCEEVVFESYYIAEEVEEDTRQVYVQQSYDEIGKGEGLLKVIEAAYLTNPDPEKFRNNFKKACKDLDKWL